MYHIEAHVRRQTFPYKGRLQGEKSISCLYFCMCRENGFKCSGSKAFFTDVEKQKQTKVSMYAGLHDHWERSNTSAVYMYMREDAWAQVWA